MDRPGFPRVIAKILHMLNGMQLVCTCIIGQRFPQGLSRVLHHWILFGTPFPDTQFVAVGAGGMDEESWQRLLGTRRCKPSDGIDKAEPIDVHLLMLSGLGHHQAHQAVGKPHPGSCLPDWPKWSGSTGGSGMEKLEPSTPKGRWLGQRPSSSGAWCKALLVERRSGSNTGRWSFMRA
jgi:hypothetical protein